MQPAPQAENGHTDIANEIMDELAKTELSGYEWRYLIFLLRKTYGYHKKEDHIPNSQFVKGTKISRQHINRTQNRLIERKIVAKNGYMLSLQKDYSSWIRNSKELKKRPIEKEPRAKNGYKSVAKNGSDVAKNGGLKRNFSKENIQKKTTYVGKATDIGLSPDSVESATLVVRDTSYFIGLFREINPAYSRLFANKTQRKAIEDLRKMLGDDNLEELITGLPKIVGKAYAPIITTPYELIVKYAKLKLFVSQSLDPAQSDVYKYTATQI